MTGSSWDELAADHEYLITLEENVQSGGFGEHVTAYMQDRHPQIRVKIVAIPDRFVEQGDVESWRKKLGLDAESVLKQIEEWKR